MVARDPFAEELVEFMGLEARCFARGYRGPLERYVFVLIRLDRRNGNGLEL